MDQERGLLSSSTTGSSPLPKVQAWPLQSPSNRPSSFGRSQLCIPTGVSASQQVAPATPTSTCGLRHLCHDGAYVGERLPSNSHDLQFGEATPACPSPRRTLPELVLGSDPYDELSPYS